MPVVLAAECFIAWGSYFGAHAALVHSLRLQNETLQMEQETAVQFALAQERLNLSREMHDVLAHRLSLISIHSSALEHRQSMDNAERIQAGRVIRSNARDCLTELRAILSDLRDAQPQGPQPDVRDIPTLASKRDSSGHSVDVIVALHEAHLPAGTGRHLYRIAQEAVTNARKHGAPGAIKVHVNRKGNHCVLTVTNPLGDTSPTEPGVGIKGMVERVHLCGGRFSRSLRDGIHVLQVSVPVEESN